MPQKRHTVDQIGAKLRKAAVELGKGKRCPKFASCWESLLKSHRTDLLPLAAEVWWYEAGDGEATEGGVLPIF